MRFPEVLWYSRQFTGKITRISLFVTLMAGVAAGAAAFWFLAVPAIKQGIYREANQQIVKYSESLVSQGAELPSPG